jgi:hypothetical protein
MKVRFGVGKGAFGDLAGEPPGTLEEFGDGPDDFEDANDA